MIQSSFKPQSVGNIFGYVQQENTVRNKHIHDLLFYMKQDPEKLSNSFQQCHLKIIKSLSEFRQYQSKNLDIYEKLNSMFFADIYKLFEEQDECWPQAQYLFKQTFKFFIMGLKANNVLIKQYCARQIIVLLRFPKPDFISQLIDTEDAKELTKCVVFLLKQRTLLKNIGIKISSFIQRFNLPDLEKHKKLLQKEVLIAMCTDESKEVRKLALSNLHLDNSNFSEFIQRIRDQDPDIRLLAIRKMITKSLWLSKIQKKADIYKFLYDGLYSRNAQVKQECLIYLKQDFASQDMPIEHPSNLTNLQILAPLRQKISHFLSQFELQNTLLYPTLQKAMDKFLETYLLHLLSLSELKMYVKEMINCVLNNSLPLSGSEWYLFRVICTLQQDEIQVIIHENFPTGVILGPMLENSFERQDLLSSFQCLKIIHLDINNDDCSKAYLKRAMDKIMVMPMFEQPLPDYEMTGENDIFFSMDDQTICNHKIMETSLENPVISESSDLVPLICQIVKQVYVNSQEYTESVKDLIKLLHSAENAKELCQNKYKLVLELLKTCRSDQMTQIIQDYVSPNFAKASDQKTKDILMQNLFAYCYHNKHFCQEYSTSIIQGIKQINLNQEQEANDLAMFIGLFDLIMVYKDQVNQDFQYVIDVLTICMIKGKAQMRQICVEGFCKILINNIYPNPAQLLTVLILLWNDKNQDQKAIQILTAFFNRYTKMSLENAQHFEQGLEGIICIANLLHNKKQAISQRYVRLSLDETEDLSKVLKTGLSLLNYSELANSESYIQLQNNQKRYVNAIQAIGPQEELFSFLCKVNSNELAKVFEKTMDTFDFFKKITPQLFSMLKFNLCPVLQKSIEIGGLKRKSFLTDLLKFLQDNEQEQTQEDLTQINQGFNQHFEKRLKSMNEEIMIVFKNLEEVGVFITYEDNMQFQEIEFEKRHFSKD